MNIALTRTEQAALTNKSGGSVAQGDVVIVDIANASSFTTTTTGAYVSGRIGVVLEPNGIANNALGMIAFSGFVPVINLSGTGNIGDLVKTHTVAKQGVRHAAPQAAGDFAQVLGTSATPVALLFGSVNPGAFDASAVDVTGTFKLSGDISPAQITSNQNDYNPTGLSGATVLRLSSDASRNITGLQGGADGRVIAIVNVGSNNIVLKDADSGSSAANRFALSGDITLAADDGLILQYDSTSSFWRCIGKSPGGAGGAPSTSNYVTTSADGSLSAEKVLPYLADYSPNIPPGSPNASNDEFDDDSIAGAWSQIGTPDTISESTYHGKLYVQDNDSTPCGVRKSYAPGASTAFTVVVKLSGILVAAFSNIILAVETSAPADIALFGIQNNNAGFLRYRSKNGGSETNPAFIGTNYGDHHYLMLQRSTSDVYVLKHSVNGINWYQVSSFTNAGTVANVAILMDSQGGGSTDSSMAIEFIRFFTSQTEVIGAAP